MSVTLVVTLEVLYFVDGEARLLVFASLTRVQVRVEKRGGFALDILSQDRTIQTITIGVVTNQDILIF
jgi:hypothetical protein